MPRVKAPAMQLLWAVDVGDCVSDLRLSADGAWAAIASLSGVVRAVAAAGDERAFAAHPGGALAVAWSPDGALLASGGQDGRARISRLDGRLVAEVDAGGWVEQLAWSPDGACLAVAAGRAVRFLSPAGALLGAVEGHASTVTALAWLPRSEQAVSACYGGVHFLRPGRDERVRRLAWKGSILALAASPDGSYLVSGNQDASVHLWRVRSGEDLEMSGFPTKVKVLAFRGDSRFLATASGQFLVVWDFGGAGPGGRKGKILEGHAGLVTDAAWLVGEGGPELVSVGLDGRIAFWAPASAARPVSLKSASGPLTKLAAAPDGRWLAVGDRLGGVSAWRL